MLSFSKKILKSSAKYKGCSKSLIHHNYQNEEYEALCFQITPYLIIWLYFNFINLYLIVGNLILALSLIGNLLYFGAISNYIFHFSKHKQFLMLKIAIFFNINVVPFIIFCSCPNFNTLTYNFLSMIISCIISTSNENIMVTLFLNVIAICSFSEITIIRYYSSSSFSLTLIFATIIIVIAKHCKQKCSGEKFERLYETSHILAHELNTPLSTMQIISKVLKRTLLKEMKKENLAVFTEFQDKLSKLSAIAGHTMLSLDMLVQNLNVSHSNMEITLVPLCEVVEEAVKDYTNFEDVDISILMNKKLQVFGNKILIKHIIFNLIKNSIKATHPERKLKIEIFSEELEEMINLVYQDNGRGIKGNTINIFRKFYTTTPRSNSGLGLYFCRKTMEKFDGSISCISKVGTYTKFILSFPYKPV